MKIFIESWKSPLLNFPMVFRVKRAKKFVKMMCGWQKHEKFRAHIYDAAKGICQKNGMSSFYCSDKRQTCPTKIFLKTSQFSRNSMKTLGKLDSAVRRYTFDYLYSCNLPKYFQIWKILKLTNDKLLKSNPLDFNRFKNYQEQPTFFSMINSGYFFFTVKTKRIGC